MQQDTNRTSFSNFTYMLHSANSLTIKVFVANWFEDIKRYYLRVGYYCKMRINLRHIIILILPTA